MPGKTDQPTSDFAWDRATLSDPHARDDKAARVEAMFDAIAPTYERVNTVASFAQDARWRRRTVAAANLSPADVVLDVCCGTGDMVRTLAVNDPAPRLILGLDFSANMLAHGAYPEVRVPLQLIRGDGLRLPLADRSVDVITCAFGVRNFQNLPAGLGEMRRVLRAGGRVLILEFALPENPLFRWGYRFHTEVILPRLGTWLSRDRSGAYKYLPKSIATFQRRGEMTARLREAGFSTVTATPMNFGGVVLYRATLETEAGQA